MTRIEIYNQKDTFTKSVIDIHFGDDDLTQRIIQQVQEYCFLSGVYEFPNYRVLTWEGHTEPKFKGRKTKRVKIK